MSQPVCAIIGAGDGLGRALAGKFASRGFDVALVSRTEQGSAAAFEAAAECEVNVRHLSADATRPETIESALAVVANEMGDVEVLIYNVRGEFTACEPLDMTCGMLDEIHRVEVVGAFAAAKSVLPAMIDRNRGSVFFSSATAAFRGSQTHPLYSIGKFGLRALSQSLAKAYSKHGVHVVHVRLDCNLDVPYMRTLQGTGSDLGLLANPDDVAESYWLAHLQPKSAWSNEIELRPCTEAWTC